MSSSRGIGVTSRDMADFLPPEILRFLLIRPLPKHTVNFEPGEAHVVKLFNEFDKYHHRYFHDPAVGEDEKRVYELARVEVEPDHWTADFQLVTALIQMPHLDVVGELEKRKGSPFTELDLKHLELRLRAARYWVDNYATEEEKTRLRETLPESAYDLAAAQKGFLRIFASLLPSTEWTGDALQICVFNGARLTPVDQPSAFKAIYKVLLDRDSGPKAGNLLSFLDRDFVTNRCAELRVDESVFWQETAISGEAFKEWLEKEGPKLASIEPKIVPVEGLGLGVEFHATMSDGKEHCRRVLVSGSSVEEAEVLARAWLAAVSR